MAIASSCALFGGTMSFKRMIGRLLFLILVIWAASTITFFIPRLSTRNPIRERFAELARSGGF
ncbi:MAG: hypothetical protein ACP5UQ_08925, partial [Anaerolineae bacterium]